MQRKNRLSEDEIIDVLDLLVSLPRRDTLREIITSKDPVAASEVAQRLNISVTEALDHLQVLERAGLITKNQQSEDDRSRWHLRRPLLLQVNISPEGIVFAETMSRAGFLQKVLSWLGLRKLKQT